MLEHKIIKSQHSESLKHEKCYFIKFSFCIHLTLHSLMAFIRRSCNFSLELYSGSSSTLKQVWAVGSLGIKFIKHNKSRVHFSNLSESDPFLAIVSLSLAKPPTGILSLPVVNWRSRLLSSKSMLWTASQNHLKCKKVKQLQETLDWKY